MARSIGDWNAFPADDFPGMSYRDYLIGQVAAGMAGCWRHIPQDPDPEKQPEKVIAKIIVRVADEILRQTQKVEPPEFPTLEEG